MKYIDIQAKELELESFSPYGTFMDVSKKEADAQEIDFSFYYNQFEVQFEGPIAVSMVCSKVQEDLLSRSLETHYKTPELLIPLDGTVYVVLALSDPLDPDRPELSTVKAFEVKQGQAILLPPGVWHRAPLAEKPTQTCCLIRKGTPEDATIVELEKDYSVIYRVTTTEVYDG